jgi:hypothetical protein
MPIELHSSVCLLSHVYLLRERPGLPFSDTLDPDLVTEALEREAVSSRERVCAPLVTLRTFLTQVLSMDQSSRAAVARLIAHLVDRRGPPSFWHPGNVSGCFRPAEGPA